MFIQLRWKDGKVKCPFHDCKKDKKIYHFKDGKRFECASCSRLFSYKTGSIMENTKIPVKKWFMAIYLHTSHKKGNIQFATFKRFIYYPKDSLVYASKNKRSHEK